MVHKTQKFEQLYQKLNQEQRLAVDTIEGPVMVVAGPGTGKTQVLATRIANILKQTDARPNNILALTFTESAAKNMRERVVEMIGSAGYQVNIATFHGFCREVINNFPEYFPIARESEPLSDLEKFNLYQSILTDLPLIALKPLNSPLFYLQEVIRSISDLKREGVSVAQFIRLVEAEFAEVDEIKQKAQRLRAQKDRAKNQELILVYEEYESRLRASARYDFDDMIMLTAEALSEHELLLLEHQERLHYILVDEYQDTNSAQNRVVDQLAAYWQSPNIFVVGDPNQSIFRFQGASLENVLTFTKRYPHAKNITLVTGYRSTQRIYDLAQTIIKDQVAEQLAKSEVSEEVDAVQSLTSARKTTGYKALVAETASRTVEQMFIARKIQELVGKGTDPAEIAVLYRTNAEGFSLMEMLDKFGINYEVAGGGNVLELEPIRQLIELFKVIQAIRDNADFPNLYEVMCYDWTEDVSSLTAMKLGRLSGKKKLALDQLLEEKAVQVVKETDNLTVGEFSTAQKFLSKIVEWGIRDFKLTFTDWFTQIIRESGYLEWVMNQPNRPELIMALNSLFREVKALNYTQHGFKLADFISTIELMFDHRLKIEVEDLNIEQQTVRLSTVHKAKGLEWQVVFVTGLVDGKWGNNRRRHLINLPSGLLKQTDLTKQEQNDEDRRLFYVALTRAKDQLYFTFPETDVSQNQAKELMKSMLLTELEEEGGDNLETAQPLTAEEAEQELEKILQPTNKLQLQADERQFFQALVDRFSLSVSALNRYLSDPGSFVEDVLLRLPKAKEAHLAFGTAAHQALEMFNQQLISGQSMMKLPQLLAHFENALTKELLTSEDFQRRLTHGQEILTAYYQQRLVDHVHPIIQAERFFGKGVSKTYLGDIHLTGRIDRIDWLDEASKQVLLVDYKTGQPKSKNKILATTPSALQQLSEREQGLPESIRGPYKRQLLFYKLLTELDQSFPYQAEQGIFEFIEPSTSGRVSTQVFSLEKADVEDLKQLIVDVMREIRSLAFLEELN